MIELDGTRVKTRQEPQPVYLMLCKPRGFVTTMHDEKGRRSVAELVADVPERVYPVGRLDYNSEGLLLMTNDGVLANALMHPKKSIDKTYLVWVSGYIAGKEQSLSQSIEIDGRKTSPAAVQLLHKAGTTALFRVTIHEGRNRQIRRLCERAELTVTRLRRVQEAGQPAPLPCGGTPFEGEKRMEQTVRWLEHKTGYPLMRAEDVRYYPLGDAMYPDMLTDLRAAKKTIYLEYFIIEPGEMWQSIVDILAQKVREGLDVRVMYDDLGSISTFNFSNALA